MSCLVNEKDVRRYLDNIGFPDLYKNGMTMSEALDAKNNGNR